MSMPKITPEMRAAIADRPGCPIEVEDDQTRKRYFHVERDASALLTEQWLRDQLKAGLAELERGDFVEFSAAEIKAKGARRLAGGK